MRSFAELAVRRGVPRLVLLSGRGEPEAEQAERAVRDTGAELTVLRSTWFMQNFSEDYMLEHEIAQASGRRVRYVPVSLEEHAFREVMDGRNAATTDDVRRALGREPRAFGDYARAAAATGVWGGSAAAA